MRHLLLRSFTLSALLAAGCSQPSQEPDDFPEPAATTADELGARPQYTTRSVAIRGVFTSTTAFGGAGDCTWDASCERIEITRADGSLQIRVGPEDEVINGVRFVNSHSARSWSRDGVVFFTTGDIAPECDALDCYDTLKVTGVIYPAREGNAWVPRIKATYVRDFPFPGDPEATQGTIRRTLELRKSAP